MKKLTVLFAAFLMAHGVFASNVDVQSAYNCMKKGQYDKAKGYIDRAVNDADTRESAKAWNYRGQIYSQIEVSKDPKIKACAQNAIDTALYSYTRAMSLDKKAEFVEDIMHGLFSCSGEIYSKGVEKYNTKEYEQAYSKFEKVNQVGLLLGRKDSLFLSSNFFAGISAESVKKPEYSTKAKECYLRLLDMKYKNPKMYVNLADIYKAEKDTSKALQLIQNIRKVLPDDLDLIIAESNIYLQQHKSVEAQNILKLAISKDPNNAVLHLAVGQKYEENKEIDNAEKEYLAAVALIKNQNDPNYVLANYNLGALYFNKFLDYKKQIDELTEGDKRYDEFMKLKEDNLKKAQEIFEGVEKVAPNDFDTLKSLRQIYSLKSNKAGYERVNEKLKKK